MIKGLKDVWGKLTPKEQKHLGEELDKMFQEEIDREIIRSIKLSRDDDGQESK